MFLSTEIDYLILWDNLITKKNVFKEFEFNKEYILAEFSIWKHNFQKYLSIHNYISKLLEKGTNSKIYFLFYDLSKLTFRVSYKNQDFTLNVFENDINNAYNQDDWPIYFNYKWNNLLKEDLYKILETIKININLNSKIIAQALQWIKHLAK